MEIIKTRHFFCLMLLMSLATHFNYFSRELTGYHVWRQTQTQSTIVNFYEEDMNILNPRKNDRGNGDGIFRMEFPLMQWLIALLYKLFGNHLIITRIFLFVIGLLSVAGIYQLVNTLFANKKMAAISAWAFHFSPCFFYYMVNPLPDNFALCCSVWVVTLFMMWLHKRNLGYLLFAGLLLSIGALCKLPFILYYGVTAIWFIHNLLKKEVAAKSLIFPVSVLLIFSALPIAWYIKVIPTWQHTGIDEGVLNNTTSWSTILDYLIGNLISVLPELLLNYASLPLFIISIYFIIKRKAWKSKTWEMFAGLGILVILYFLFEINMIGTVHDYYLIPFLPLLFILVGYGAFHACNTKRKTTQYIVFALILLMPLTCYLRVKIRWDKNTVGFNKDLLTYKNELRNSVPKNALCIVENDDSHFIYFYFLDKKGWCFDSGNLNEEILAKHINNGAAYLYTDSEKPMQSSHIDSLLLKKGSIQVYRLK